jgi:hypothetical protein
MQSYGQDFGINGVRPSLWERLASGLAALGTFAFFFSAVGYGWYSLLLAMAR